MNGEEIVYRVERDIVGEKKVPAGAYYGIQSLRALENFPITGRRLRPEMITSLALIKKAAAITNRDAGALSAEHADAIITACDEILAGGMADEFIVDPIQGGAGTSTNMNINEVVANRASEILGGRLGSNSPIHPNDHVNLGQSTNDVYPSCGKMAAVVLMHRLSAALDDLIAALMLKSAEFDAIIKMGRTQLQDAVPIRLGQEFRTYAGALKRDRRRIDGAINELRVLNMGGTAIGTAVNAKREYVLNIVKNISLLAGEEYRQADDLVDDTQNADCYAAAASTLKCLAIDLTKICNDLRLMSSGPRTGLGEINLPACQNGSSIMPGKVNPVIPEVVNQIAFLVMGNDLTITLASQAGQLELNAFEPVIFDRLFESITTLIAGMETLTHHCVSGITANRERCRELLNSSIGIVTVLCPYIGYTQACDLAKESLATHVSVQSLVIQKGLMTEGELNDILSTYIETA